MKTKTKFLIHDSYFASKQHFFIMDLKVTLLNRRKDGYMVAKVENEYFGVFHAYCVDNIDCFNKISNDRDFLKGRLEYTFVILSLDDENKMKLATALTNLEKIKLEANELISNMYFTHNGYNMDVLDKIKEMQNIINKINQSQSDFDLISY